METILIRLFLGHVVGDFFFQTGNMANNKYLPGWKGFFWCSVHVLVYTTIVTLSIGNLSPIFWLGVYIQHWIVDRWSLAYQWMKLIGRGSLLPSKILVEVSLGSIIYVTIDQTIHLGYLLVLLKFVV